METMKTKFAFEITAFITKEKHFPSTSAVYDVLKHMYRLVGCVGALSLLIYFPLIGAYYLYISVLQLKCLSYR